jgi:hypothetical protein
MSISCQGFINKIIMNHQDISKARSRILMILQGHSLLKFYMKHKGSSPIIGTLSWNDIKCSIIFIERSGYQEQVKQRCSVN